MVCVNLIYQFIIQNLKDTFVYDFIHELRNYLVNSDVTYRLSKLPQDTLLDINEIEKNHIQCYFNHEEYNIPKEMIYRQELNGLVNDGFIKLQLQESSFVANVGIMKSDSLKISSISTLLYLFSLVLLLQ